MLPLFECLKLFVFGMKIYVKFYFWIDWNYDTNQSRCYAINGQSCQRSTPYSHLVITTERMILMQTPLKTNVPVQLTMLFNKELCSVIQCSPRYRNLWFHCILWGYYIAYFSICQLLFRNFLKWIFVVLLTLYNCGVII